MLLKCLLFLTTLTSCEIAFNNSSDIDSITSDEITSGFIDYSSEEVSSSSYSSKVSISSNKTSSSSYYSDTSGFTVSESGKYTDVESVAKYIVTFHKLPSNYVKKSQSDNYDNSYSIGGDYFGNNEGYLPSSYNGSYRECDIDATKNKRGAKRIVYEVKTYRVFYTTDHYENFKEYYGYKNWSALFGESNDIY